MYNCCWPCMPYMDMCNDNSDLERMYPKIYHKVRPLIIMHCDDFERKHGCMCCPSHKELDDACDHIYKNIKKHLDKMHDKDHEKCYRQRGYDRRSSLNDLFRILLIGELLGRRRRHRRRRRPHYGY